MGVDKWYWEIKEIKGDKIITMKQYTTEHYGSRQIIFGHKVTESIAIKRYDKEHVRR